MSIQANGKIAVYGNIVDRRMRLVLRYHGLYYPIFWFQIKKDGSIYLGPRYTNINLMKKGSKATTSDGSTNILYNEGEIVTSPQLLKTSKTSFHASGAIHFGGEKVLGRSLRSLSEAVQLCMVLFTHPTKYARIDRPDKNDIVLTDAIIEENPMIAKLYVTPLAKKTIRRDPSTKNQIALAFEITGLKGVPDVLLQILLIQPVPGPWPPYSYVIFASEAPK